MFLVNAWHDWIYSPEVVVRPNKVHIRYSVVSIGMRRCCINVPDGWSKWGMKHCHVQIYIHFLSPQAGGNGVGDVEVPTIFSAMEVTVGRASSLPEKYLHFDNLPLQILKMFQEVSWSWAYHWTNGFVEALAVSALAWCVNYAGHVKALSLISQIHLTFSFLFERVAGCWMFVQDLGFGCWLCSDSWFRRFRCFVCVTLWASTLCPRSQRDPDSVYGCVCHLVCVMGIPEPQPFVEVWTFCAPHTVLCMYDGPIVVTSFDVINH